jgi:hypothetical protein
MSTSPKLALAGAALLLSVNLVIVAPLFGVEYLAHNGSVEGTFIAITRVMAERPGEWGWWPFWAGGMPFENTYLPLMNWIAAAVTLLTGLSPARAFHVVAAGIYALGPLMLFWMASALSQKLGASFFAALAYSCFSPAAALIPAIRSDVGGPSNLRRLQNLVFYGEAPHILALVLLPLAILCFSQALTGTRTKWRVLNGVTAALIALSNFFGIVALLIALLCWLLAFRPRPCWKALVTLIAIGTVSYCWVSPWLSPAMIRATLENASTSGGDFRYTGASWLALSVVAAGYPLLWVILRRLKAAADLQFFVLLAYAPAAFVVAWHSWKVAVIPQAHRYELEFDMVLTLAAVFLGGAVVNKLPRVLRGALIGLVALGLALQTVHSVSYGRKLIRPAEYDRLSEYKIAKWFDRNLPGQRAFIPGSASLLYNAFTDNPQLHGAHEQHVVNSFVRIVAFLIYTGLNAGDRDAEISVFWLKAFGLRAIAVTGLDSTEYYKPFADPRKFEGVLPVLWREGDDVIYAVPARSASLAHVIPAEAVPARRPIHGLDIDPVEAYVAALDDPRYPPAGFRWKNMNEAEVEATVAAGQVVSVQITYERGWEAWVEGQRRPVRGDAIGQMVIDPDCTGPCGISLRYTGGNERILTRLLSAAAMLVAGVYVWRRRGGWG